jgi:hypothetical protein
MLRKPDGGPRRNAGFWGVSCLFALILVCRPEAQGAPRGMERAAWGPAEYTESSPSRQLLLRTALVSKLLSLSSPLFKSSRWVAGWPQRVFCFWE